MQSMEEIYQQHAQTVYRYFLAQTRSADLAEELTQETFYQAVRTAGQYRGEGRHQRLGQRPCSLGKRRVDRLAHGEALRGEEPLCRRYERERQYCLAPPRRKPRRQLYE